MKAKIKHIEEGVVLLSNQPLLHQLGDGTEVEVSSSGASFVLTPVHDEQLEQILDEMDEQYGSVFRRLAE